MNRNQTFVVLLLSLMFSATGYGKDTLTVYTSRKTHLIQPLFDAYQKKTGVKIEHINGKAGALIQKLKQEGDQTVADLLVTVDAGNLGFAADQGLLAPLSQESFVANIPEKYRGVNDQWVGLSLRARTLFFNKKALKSSDLVSYEDLANPKWKGKLCLRTSRKVYNQSLVAGLIKRHGEKKTTEIVEGWVKNLAKPVFTSDSQLLQAIDRGDCQVGIANTYYLARLIKKKTVQNVGIFWPLSRNGGVHINVSGAGLVKASSKKPQAVAFLEWLTTKEAQKMFAGLNDEYPVIQGVSLSPILKQWGEFTADQTPLKDIGALQKKAVLLMDKARYR
ncbi:MAG: extracellular solute-binding protein [Pseudomonadota bacterium]